MGYDRKQRAAISEAEALKAVEQLNAAVEALLGALGYEEAIGKLLSATSALEERRERALDKRIEV